MGHRRAGCRPRDQTERAVRLSKAEERLRQELVAELKAAEQLVTYRFAELLGLLKHITGDVNEAIRSYNAGLVKTKVFVEGVAETFRDAYEEKSDKWKEGDAGQEADAFISEWESIDFDPIPELEILEPELEEKPCLAAALESLPTESQ